MSRHRARQLFKALPKSAVLYFDCDKTTDIRPTATIIDEKDKIFEGNTVTVQYGQDQLQALIIKLSGM